MTTRRSSPTSKSEPPARGASAAPLFWMCLIAAVALYAPCVLAGRFVAWWELQHRYLRNQGELVAAQHQIRHLQRVADALEQDPDFAAQVARAELGAAPSRTHVIPLPPELNSDPRIPPDPANVEPSAEAWYVPVLRRIAGDAALRRNLLCAAAGIFLLGFLAFREAPQSVAHAATHSSRRGARRTIFGRYLTESEQG